MRQLRRSLATDAATAVLRATLDPSQTGDQKMAAVEAIMDQYLSYSPGCTFDNRWCQAPERGTRVVFIGGLSHDQGGDDEGADRRDLSLTARQDQPIARLDDGPPAFAP